MRRRHLLALVILTLVVATVLASGSFRDWITTWRGEEYWPNGQLSARYTGPRWSRQTGLVERWTQDGTLATRIWIVEGRQTSGIEANLAGPVRFQKWWSASVPVEIRRSPPWFTEEEILQSVEGVEE